MKEGEEVEANESNRQLIYEMFCNSPLNEFKFVNLYNFYRLAYSFIMHDKDHTGKLAIAEVR
jgi:hypothetical protein